MTTPSPPRPRAQLYWRLITCIQIFSLSTFFIEPYIRTVNRTVSSQIKKNVCTATKVTAHHSAAVGHTAVVRHTAEPYVTQPSGFRVRLSLVLVVLTRLTILHLPRNHMCKERYLPVTRCVAHLV